MVEKETTRLIIKCIQFYIDYVTNDGTKCPSVDEMKEIVKLDDVIKGLDKKNANEK